MTNPDHELLSGAGTAHGGAAEALLSAPTRPGRVRERLAAAVLARLLRRVGQKLPAVLVPDTGKPQGGAVGVKHTEVGPQERTLASLWAREGESPCFTGPSTLTDLQVWHRGKLHTFTGLEASRRLTCLAPTVFSEEIGGRKGAVAQASVGARLGFRITGQSLARSYAGAAGIAMRDASTLADRIVHPKWRPLEITGQTKNRRFFDCVIRVFAYFRLLARRHDQLMFDVLGGGLVADMLRWGRCRTALVEAYLTSLMVILHGKSFVKHELHEALLALPKEQRAELWKSQRLFARDDNDPLANATIAMKRMTVPVLRSTEEDARAMKVLENFQRRASDFVTANFERLKYHHDHASLHRSAATIYFTRNRGGGAAEMHLMVGLYRLASGQPSPLQDVWGITPEDLSMEDLYSIMDSQHRYRKEIEAASSWFLDELERRKVSYPYICIYPEREVKSRCFMLLPYALQQGGYQAATTIALYLRSRADTREVFAGFDDTEWLRRLRRDIEEGATHLLSLDSQVSTDPLPHSLCRMVFTPFYGVFSDLTKKAVEKTFAPTRVHTARTRPKDFLKALSFEATIMEGLKTRVRGVTPASRGEVLTHTETLRVHPECVPTHLRTYSQRQEIVRMLKQHGRVLLKAPTGSGKTVLAATLFNAIVQFPSVAALELMSAYLTSLNVPHNVHHARRKSDPLEWDHEAGEPRTILCTSYFVRSLNAQFPGMVIGLDEAETKQENYVINVEYTRHRRCLTLLMSATPDELRGEEYTPRVELEGGTNFPVTHLTCTYTQMQEMLVDPDLPPALVCAHSEPLCDKLASLVQNGGRSAVALTARMRSQADYLDRLQGADVILATNAIRSSVTLPELEVVFDLTRIYESVDFPLSGMESLVLTEVSEAMRIQCAGRVGRLAPGIYYRVLDAPGQAIPYTPTLLSRVPVIARASERIPLRSYSRELNAGSIIVERFSQRLASLAGVKAEPFCPLWASVIRQKAPHQTPRLIATVAFEALGLVNRTRQVAQDLDMRVPYENFVKESRMDYHDAARALLKELQRNGWFPSEIAQINRWAQGFELEEDEPIGSPENLRAMALALWRQMASRRGSLLVGMFRNFSCTLPHGSTLEEGEPCLAFGLSLHNNAVSARWAIPLLPDTVNYVTELVGQVGAISVVSDALDEGKLPAVLGWDVVLSNKGRQTKRLELSYSGYTRNHTFQPGDEERIWEAMTRVVDEARHSEDEITHQGSPMSATASFTVLNSFGLAAHDSIRDGLHEGIQEPMHGAGIFGDDDVRAASAEAIAAGTQDRESLGLQTKWSATGLAEIASGGKLLGNTDQLGLFTERLIDLSNLSVVSAVKPAGLVRLFQSHYPHALALSTVSHRADMLSYEKQLHFTDPRWARTVISTRQQQMLVARRETAPRRILSRLLKKRVGVHSKVAVGDVGRLFEHLELLLLQVCPSTKGEPDRLPEGPGAPLGHPVISINDARELESYLQGEDCYFKLHGPPLQLHGGPRAYEVAVQTLMPDAAHAPSVSEAARCVAALGWGTEAPPDHASHDEPPLPNLGLDPIEYGDSID